MALKKPSDFYIKPEEKSSLDSVKEELASSKPEKIEKISEAFSVFKSNLNRIQSLNDFSSTFESFKHNVEKVETISTEIGEVKKEIQTLIKKEDLDDAMMAHLFFVEEAIAKVEDKISGVNENIVNKISDDFSETSEMVNSFLDIEVPKYKNLIAESEVRIDNRFVNLKDSVEENLDTIRADVNKEVTTALSEVETINQHSLSTIRDEVGDIIDVINEDLPQYKKFFAETELRTEEKISEAQNIFDEKINFINQTYQERLEELNSTVKEFTNTEIPKYSRMLVESKLKSEEEVKELETTVLKKVNDLTEQIENLYKVNNIKETDIDSLLEKVQTTVQESKNQTEEIFESYARLCKDSRKREVSEDKKLQTFSNRLERFAKQLENIEETTVQDVLELQANLDISTSAYHDKLKKEVNEFEENLTEQIKDLEVNLNTNEVHIKKQNEYIESIKEEVQDVIGKLHIESIEKKNKALIEKVNHIEEVLSKFSEKALLTEDTPITPGSPDTKTGDPLTSLDQNYVTLKQLQDHYRLFINRIQVQLSSIGGGGAGFIKDLADVSFDESTGTNKLLIYNGTEWVGIDSTSLGSAEAITGVGIQSASTSVGYGFTDINFVGSGVSSITGSGTTVTIDIPATTIRRQVNTSSGVTTDFTISGGYAVGFIDVFMNGVKQRSGTDFLATTGTGVTMTPAVNDGDVLEFQVYENLTVAKQEDPYVGTAGQLLQHNGSNYVGVSSVGLATFFNDHHQGYYRYSTNYYTTGVANTVQTLPADEFVMIQPSVRTNKVDFLPQKMLDANNNDPWVGTGATIGTGQTQFSLAGLDDGSTVIVRIASQFNPDIDNTNLDFKLEFTTNPTTQGYGTTNFSITREQALICNEGADQNYISETLINFYVGSSLSGMTTATAGSFNITARASDEGDLEMMALTVNVVA